MAMTTAPSGIPTSLLTMASVSSLVPGGGAPTTATNIVSMGAAPAEKTPKEKEKDRIKAAGKRTKFLDPTSNVATRSKALLSYCALEGDQESIGALFRDHHAMVFSAFTDNATAAEASARRGKHLNDKEMRKLVTLCRLIVLHLQSDLRDPRNARCVGGLVEKLLFLETAHTARLAAYEILLAMIEAVPELDENPWWAMVINSVNLASFATAATETSHNSAVAPAKVPAASTAPDKGSILYPPSSNSKDKDISIVRSNTVEMLDLFFKAAGRSPQALAFWHSTILKFLALLYPEPSLKAGIPGASAERGFLATTAPPDLQAVVAVHLLKKWLTNEALLEAFAGKEPLRYSLLFMAGYRTALRLPPSHAQNLGVVIKTFFDFFLVQRRSIHGVPQQSLTEVFQRGVLEDSTYLFGPGPVDGPDLVSLCSLLCKLYNVCLESHDQFDPMIRRTVFYTVLKATQSLLSPTQPNPNTAVVDSIRPLVMDTLLNGWIKAPVTDPAMWADFQKTLEPLFCHPEVVRIFRTKLMFLTKSVKELCYPKYPTGTVVPGSSPAPATPVKPEMKLKPEVSPGKKEKKEKASWCLDSREPIEKTLKHDITLSQIQWNVDTLLWIWHAVLRTLFSVNNHRNPKTHEGIMQTMADVLDILVSAEDSSPLLRPEAASQSGESISGSKIPLIPVFAPYLFEATKIEEPARSPGVCVAYTAMARLLIRRYPALPATLLSHFYDSLMFGLNSNDRMIWWSILTSCYAIFGAPLPGSSVLISAFVTRAKDLIVSSYSPPAGTSPSLSSLLLGRQKLLSLLGSLLCYPAHFPDLELRYLPSVAGVGATSPLKFTSTTLRETLHSTLIAVLYAPQMQTECKVAGVWSLVVAVAEELAHFNGDRVGDLIHAILLSISGDDPIVSRTALQAISHLASSSGKLLPAELSNSVIDGLCTVILTQKVNELIMPFVFITLCDWLLVELAPNSVSEESLQKLFNAIEFGLLSGSNGAGNAASDSEPLSEGRSRPRMLLNLLRPGGSSSSSSSSNSPAEESSSSSSSMAMDRKLTIRDGAEILLAHCLQFRQNFPNREGVDVWCSRISEGDDGADEDRGTYWVLNNMNILTNVDVPPAVSRGNNNNPIARLIMRESSGKWAWDFFPIHTHSDTGLPDTSIEPSVSTTTSTMTTSTAEEGEMLTRPRASRSLYTPVFVLSAKNKLSDTIDATREEHPELCSWGAMEPSTVLVNRFKSTIDEMNRHMESIAAEEKSAPTAVSLAESTVSSFAAPEPPAPVTTLPVRGTSSRLLLNQLGIISPLGTLSNSIERLVPSEKWKRNVLLMDRTPGRMVHKIGLIYVSEGQEFQNEILANCHGSPLYSNLTAGLGWLVNVTQHRGYLGGLDKTGSTGPQAIYWGDNNCEVVFHEVVGMPTAENDPQQIQKKRHVGNDFVHLIWSEHLRDYNPLTITSQFNEAHVILYPLANGLFRVQVYRNPNNGLSTLFGPLQHGMVISKDILAPLVRETCLNADRAINSMINPDIFTKPYLNRQRLVMEAIDRYHADELKIGYLQSLSSVTLSNTLVPPNSSSSPSVPAPAPPPPPPVTAAVATTANASFIPPPASPPPPPAE